MIFNRKSYETINRMNLYLVFYILLASALFLAGISKLYGMGMTLSAVLFFLGAGSLLILYGLRWFGTESSLLSQGPVQWPPLVNTCPDYLTYYKRKKEDGTMEETCVDTVGVSRNATLKQFTTDGSPPSGENFYFPLATKSSDVVARNAELCQRAITFGLTWEGITNGESCVLPDGSKASPSSSGTGGAGCPA
jgi:hypothetical protein